MTEKDNKSNVYFCTMSNTLSDAVSVVYESCYHEDGSVKDADFVGDEEIEFALIELIVKTIDILESSSNISVKIEFKVNQ